MEDIGLKTEQTEQTKLTMDKMESEQTIEELKTDQTIEELELKTDQTVKTNQTDLTMDKVEAEQSDDSVTAEAEQRVDGAGTELRIDSAETEQRVASVEDEQNVGNVEMEETTSMTNDAENIVTRLSGLDKKMAELEKVEKDVKRAIQDNCVKSWKHVHLELDKLHASVSFRVIMIPWGRKLIRWTIKA